MNKIYLLLCLFFGVKSSSFSQIHLPRFISDGMVLQRDKPLKLWGWASANEAISLEFNKQTYKTQADAAGKWSLLLPPQKANEGGDMVFKGSNEVIIKDVIFGDVWLCSGQSNMVLPMERVKEKYPDDIASANYPNIRFFLIPTLTHLEERQTDFPSGAWKQANPKDVLSFSATAYFFARDIYEKYKIPIGLINPSVGGTPIEAWISEEGLTHFEDLTKSIQKNKVLGKTQNQKPEIVTPSVSPPKSEDVGLKEHWFDPNYTPKGWRNINIPGYWEDQGIKDLNGVVWYRKEIDIPASMTGVPAKLFMGRIIDADFTYINGVQVGNITYQYPPRRYNIDAGVLKVGKNSLVIRVLNYKEKGGFVPDKPYFLTANGQNIDLKGTWQYKVGEVFEPANSTTAAGFSAQNQPAALFNAMVAPLTGCAIKGILWYQGETNTNKPETYAQLLPALIADWRKQFQDPNLPFLYPQLPNFMDVNYLPSESSWAVLREGQKQTLSVPNTAMAVTIDAGEWNDIHPLSKKEVGQRLALAARKLAYGETSLVHSGPLFKSATIENKQIRLSFDQAGSGLVARDGEPLRWFSIADFDKKFVWAKAVIEGNEIIVSSERVPTPQYVRYAWADNPDNVNFYNKEGLPASPFTTERNTLDPTKAWQGKKCAVVLTYDDALNVHLDNAIPLLDSLSLKGTFYLTGTADACKKRLKDWRKAAQNGHELGNHTLFHPCDGSKTGRSWLTPERDMSKYSIQRMTDEMKATNVLLEAMDGKTQRTFAFTCGDRAINGNNFIDSLKNDFIAARAVRHEMHPLEQVDLYNIDCYAMNGETGEQMIDLVKKAQESGKLLVFLFHGVGGEHGLNVDLNAHRQLLRYLKNNEQDIWIAPLLEVAEHIKKQQAGKVSEASSTKGLTGIRDTSYSNFNALKNTLKTHPQAVLVSEIPSKNVQEHRNIPYCHTGTRDLYLDAFYPNKKPKKPQPALLIIHGGGWRTGNRSQHIPLAQRLAALGYTTFTAEYRLSTEALYPAAVHDLKAAIRWIRANAQAYNVDTNKIATLGFSAGGQLSALIGNTNNMEKFEGTQGYLNHSSQVQAIVDIDGILAFIHPESGEGDDSRSTSAATNWFGFSKTENPQLWQEGSALTYAGKDSPSTLFINSSVARMHAGREDYRQKLSAFNIYCDVQTFDNSPHSFCLFSPWFEPTVTYIDAFLKKVLVKE